MKKELTYAEKIEYYAQSSQMISVNNGNAKTGKACLTLSFPQISCRCDAPCRKDCYCSRGHQQYPTVQGAYRRNWRLWHEDPQRFEVQLDAVIKFNCLPLFRYCDCGDIPDYDFLLMMVRIAEKNPTVKFLAYTKKYEMITLFFNREDRGFPDNLTIRLSEWDKSWAVSNPRNLPTSIVCFKDNEKNGEIKANAFWCKGGSEYTCSQCQVCWNKKVKQVAFKQH